MEIHVLLPLSLIPAILLGELGRKAGFPVVIGQIVTGFLLGPVVFGLLPNELDSHGTENGSVGNGFFEIAEIGICVLLFRVGLETRISEFAAVWKPATRVALAGMLVPMALGIAAAVYVLGWDLWPAVFVGAALTATSIGVTVSVLEESNASHTPEARIILGAAVLDDVLGLLLLSLMVTLVTPGVDFLPELGWASLRAIGFLGGSLLIGPYLVKMTLRLCRWCDSHSVLVVIGFSYLFLMSVAAEKSGLAMIIGAYAAGLTFARHPQRDELEAELKPFTELFTPLFFVVIGASISLADLSGSATFDLLVLVVVAVLGKLLAGYAVGRKDINRAIVGSGMMPRGEVGFVFAKVAIGAGVLVGSQYAVLAIVLVLTTLAGPLILRRSLRKAS